MKYTDLRRAAKYFAFLVVLYVVIVAVLCATGMSAIPVGEMGYALFCTWRGGLLWLMALGLGATYPIRGFVQRQAEADFVADRELIVGAFASAGFVLTAESAGEMTFRAASPLRRLRLLGEDEIKVRSAGERRIVVDGIRSVAVPVALRIHR